MTALSSNVCFTDEDESKRIIVHKNLSQSCSTNKEKSKQRIFSETLSQNYYVDVEELCSTEEEKSKCTITEQKDADNEVTYDVPYNFNVSNLFECGINNHEVSYEKMYVATSGDEYFTEMFDHLNKYHDRHGQILSSKNLKESVLRIMEEEEEEIKSNINNITCDTSFQYPVAMNVQKKDANFSLDRQLASGVLAEIFENFKGCTIQSDKQVDKIIDSEEHVDARSWLGNDSAKQVDAISDYKKLVMDGSNPKSNPRVSTHTTN